MLMIPNPNAKLKPFLRRLQMTRSEVRHDPFRLLQALADIQEAGEQRVTVVVPQLRSPEQLKFSDPELPEVFADGPFFILVTILMLEMLSEA